MTSGIELPPAYPARWEADVVLSDGGTVHIRPIKPSDGDGLRDLHRRLSPEARYMRFFSPMPRLPDGLVERFVNVDYADRMALVAVLGGRVIGVARYDRLPSGVSQAGPHRGADAEVAFTVDDAHQGRGVGTILLEHLAAAAKHAGIARFVADTLPHNERMLGVFQAAGFETERTFTEGVVRVVLPIEPTEASIAAMHERERNAAAHSVRRLLSPRSVAVVGASRRPGTIGHETFRNLINGRFAGPVYPVHPTASHIASVRAYPSVLDVPGDVDLVVIVVPAASVPDVVEQCGQRGVTGIVIISAGFAERGDQGAAVERALVVNARANGMRLVGPNCLGVINTDPAVNLNATFSPVPPTRGRIGFFSQSGGLGVAILDEMGRRGLGVSTFVSAGNKADISNNDLLHYWDGDDQTDVVLLYVESFGNPRSFARIARRLSRTKPIVAVKGGRSPAGVSAATLHTASVPSADPAVDALFLQSGVIRVDTTEELFDVAQVLATQPLPPGRRVGIVANAGGPGVLTADACEAAGLSVPSLGPATQARLRAVLGDTAVVQNPVDMAPTVHPDEVEETVRAVLADDSVDAVITIFAAPLSPYLEETIGAVFAAAGSESTKPVLTSMLGRQVVLRHGDQRVPSFSFPESAVRALARAAALAEWRARDPGRIPELDGVNTRAARLLVSTALAEFRYDAPAEADFQAGVWLDGDSAAQLVSYFGIPVARPPVDCGTEMLIEVVQDDLFGSLVSFGTGGPVGKLLGDRALRALPLTDVDARELVRSIRGAALLAPFDLGRFEDMVLRVGRLVEDLPEVQEMTLDPVVSSPEGAIAGAVRVRVAPWEPRPERALRRLG